MYTIQANPSGTRSLEVSEENLATIEKYGLFRHLIDSNGIVDETVLDKLKLNIHSHCLAITQSSADETDFLSDVMGYLQTGGIEVDVIGHQRHAGTDSHCACGGL